MSHQVVLDNHGGLLLLLQPCDGQSKGFVATARTKRRRAINGGHGRCRSRVDLFNDIDGLAALICACDAVVSVDNTTVHLGGALGAPVSVLLPFHPDWRWQLNRSDSPWYPSLTLLRQQRRLLALGRPLLVGWSRKRTLGQLTGRPVDQRLAASVAAAQAAVTLGARVVRVHDVAATVDALKVWQASGLADSPDAALSH